MVVFVGKPYVAPAQTRRILAEAKESFSSGAPESVKASVAIIETNNPILDGNKVSFEISEFRKVSEIEGASELLTPVTRVYFIQKSDGEPAAYDDSKNPI